MSDSPSVSHFLWTQPQTVWRQLLRPWFEACAGIGWETGAAPSASGADSLSVSPSASTPTDGAHLAPRSPIHAPMLLAPDAGMIAWIKGLLVAEGIGCLGVHFHTPGTLRSLLAQAYRVQGQLALREDLHLIMGQAARTLPDNPVAQAAALDPASLCRLCDCIDRADWRAEGFSTTAARQLAVRYFEMLAAQGLRTVADLERQLLLSARQRPLPACGYLLAVGFGSEHAESLLLLRAASLSARNPILCLDTTDASAGASVSAAALSWQAACEEHFGLARPLGEGASPSAPDAAPVGDDALAGDDASSALGNTQPRTSADTAACAAFTDLGTGTTASALPVVSAFVAWTQVLGAYDCVDSGLRIPLQHTLRLLTFRTVEEEAAHTVEQVRDWLAQAPPCGFLRIGIILPGGGSLPGREIAAGLSALGIPHYDSLGHQPAREAGQKLLEAWCGWQNSNQIDDFNAFLAELCHQNRLPAVDLRRWERAVDKALSQTLCAELGVVAACLGAPAATGEASAPVSQGIAQQILEQWPQLPEQASFSDFWAQTQPLLELFEWPSRPEPLLERARAFGQCLEGRLPRSAFIGWLRAVTRVPGRTRNPLGHEPFAPVHLITLAEASRQQWSHLCVVGMVHGAWPPPEADSALLDPQRCAELNHRAERPSRFGQGQSYLGGSHTFLASARQRREHFDAAFLRLLRQSGVRCAVLSRYRFEPGGGKAEAFASEYFLRSVYAACGALEISETQTALRSAVPPSAQVILPPSADAVPSPSASPSVQAVSAPLAASLLQAVSAPLSAPYPQVALAYARRRDPYSGFDAYSYALSTPPPEPLRLSCSHWAEALTRPAHAWYRYVLRVRKRRRAADSDFRLLSRGIWVHHWLNPCAGAAGQPSFVPRPSAVVWQAQITQRAQALYRFISAVYTRAGRQLPQWWQSDWSAALALADAFARELGDPATDEPTGELAETRALAGLQTRSDDANAPTVETPSGHWRFVGGEWPLAPVRLDMPEHPLHGLMLEGVVDLLLAADASAEGLLCPPAAVGLTPSATTGDGGRGFARSAPDLWVVDYKTGSDAGLSLKSWEAKANGLQLVLYALALRAHGAGRIRMTMLRKGAALEPQLELDELSPSAQIWHRLALPMRAGVFGMRGALRDPHGFTGDYPVATLGIDPVILERKARLTEWSAPALVR